MKKHIPMRLGPLALLLTVITICLVTLGILTLSTAGADLRLAQRYADSTEAEYEREAEGQKLLKAAYDAVSAGEPLDSVDGMIALGDGEYEYTVNGENAYLEISLKETENGFEVTGWRTVPLWDDSVGINIFGG